MKMLTTIRSLFLAVLLGAGSSAQANVFDLGANPIDESITLLFPAGSAATFEDTVQFSVTQVGSVVSTAFSNWPVASQGLRNLELELFRGNTLLASTGPSAVTNAGPGIPVFTLQSLSQALAIGDYRLTLSGNVQSGGGFYNWNVSTVAVPEPEQWALLMAGLAVVVGGAYRRRQSARG
jgi:hypothetical protein